MAVDYTKLFTEIGSLIKGGNQFKNSAIGTTGAPKPDIPALLLNVQTLYGADGNYALLEDMQTYWEGFKDSQVSVYDQISRIIEGRLLDRSTVKEQLSLNPQAGITEVLLELWRDMTNTPKNINRSAVAAAAVVAVAGNTGTGTIVSTTTLDAKSIPIAGGIANQGYRGQLSEVAVNETLAFTCVADEDSDGYVSGEELFFVEGLPKKNSPFDWRTEGSGTSEYVTTANASQNVSNKDFELWTNNVPNSWDRDTGVAGTNIIQMGTAANVHRGNYSLQLKGDGATATLQISQTFPLGSITPGKMYCLGVNVKADAGIAGTSALLITLAGTGYVAGGTETIAMTQAQLAAQAAFGLKTCFINMPMTIPDDFEIQIKATGTLTNLMSIYLDSLALAPVTYVNGVGVAIFAGATQFVRNDRFTIAVTNNDAGVFQKYFRQKYRAQLPSSGAPNISDALAT